MTQSTLTIPRAWLERLIEINEKIRTSEKNLEKEQWLMVLSGYIESAKALLNQTND